MNQPKASQPQGQGQVQTSGHILLTTQLHSLSFCVSGLHRLSSQNTMAAARWPLCWARGQAHPLFGLTLVDQLESQHCIS